VLCREDDVPRAVTAVHSAFDLDATDELATVYGGTGR
jgi:aspartate kinase